MTIPDDVLKIFEEQTSGLEYGTVNLTVHMRQGSPRYTIGKEISLLEKGVDNPCPKDSKNEKRK